MLSGSLDSRYGPYRLSSDPLSILLQWYAERPVQFVFMILSVILEFGLFLPERGRPHYILYLVYNVFI